MPPFPVTTGWGGSEHRTVAPDHREPDYLEPAHIELGHIELGHVASVASAMTNAAV